MYLAQDRHSRSLLSGDLAQKTRLEDDITTAFFSYPTTPRFIFV